MIVPDFIETLIFDCDGTLANTLPIHDRAWKSLLAKKGIVDYDVGFFDRVTGLPTREMAQLFNKTFNANLDPESFTREKDDLAEASFHEVTPIDVVIDIARKYFGKLNLAVASGGSRAMVTRTLQHLGIIDMFSLIVTADDPVRPKPDPEIFLHVARHFNTAPGLCLVFEDGDYGLQAAKSAGMLSIDVRPYINR